MHDLDAESARVDEAHEVDRLLSPEEGASSSCEPVAWRSAVEQAWWYRASPFAFCAAGGLLVLRPEPLERGLPLFPWRCTGLAIVINGFASFMGDVETWGRPSAWKFADRVMATTNTVLQILVVVLGCSGYAKFPVESVACLGTGVGVGLFCKHRGSVAFERGDCEAFLRWHSAWHYVLPLGAILGQLVLHRPCDYAMPPPHGLGSCALQGL